MTTLLEIGRIETANQGARECDSLGELMLAVWWR